MLSPEYLDRLPEAVMKQIEDAELAIIRDMARRIAKAGEVTATAEWQMLKLQEMGAEQSFILGELRRVLELSDKELQELFIRAAEKTLETDDEIYRAAGYDPPPLKESPFAETVIRSGYIRTRGTFYNLTETTARTAGKQFERILDEGHLRLTSGAFSYQDVIRWGVKKLAEEGVKAIEYPSGHTDSLDTAYRRATLTGLNQAGLKLQEERIKEMGAEYVETTAHAGARPSHTVWQGRIFKLRGSDEKYDNFYTATGYGTGEGLGGWNCRHGFYPFFPGISEPANSEEYLRQLNEKSVKYNGEKLSMYEATQKQRYMERQIRRWKREAEGLKAAGQDDGEARAKVRYWQARQRDFVNQTGLQRDYFRERAGRQLHGDSFRSSGIKLYDITDETIERLPDMEYSTLSREAAGRINLEHREVLKLAQKEKAGTEVGIICDTDGQRKWQGVGGESGTVKIPRVSYSHVAIHNHPDDMIFSGTDIKSFIERDGLRVLTAVGNNGTIYTVSKTEKYSVFEKNSLLKDFRNLKQELKSYVNNGDITGYVEAIERFLTGGEKYEIRFNRKGQS